MIIYKCQNKISGKIYIGQTIKTLDERKLTHLNSSKFAKSKFHKALKSYGIDSFDWEVLATATTKEQLNKLEIDYINQYDSINNGYNMVDGGTGGYNQFAVEANKKIRTGKTYYDIYSSIEMADKMKLRRKLKANNIFNNYTKEQRKLYAKLGNKMRTLNGYKHSDETKQKISDSQIGISYQDRHGKEEAQLLKDKISKTTKEAMKKVDWDTLMEKALESRNKFWDTKHEEQKKKILELKTQNIPIKTIIARLNISTPTYYKLWNSIKNK
jgi:group I intron endonuclease